MDIFNIFLSWSGKRSLLVAQAFEECLPILFPKDVDIYLSSSMNKGVPWLAVLDENLKNANFAILCVTRENRAAPWMMYEAGVLSQTAGANNVAPFLLDIDASELQSPVTRSQITVFEREDLEKLVLTINQLLPEKHRAKAESEKELSALKKLFPLAYGLLEPLLQKALDFQDEDGAEDVARKTLAGVEGLLELSKSYLFDMKKRRR